MTKLIEVPFQLSHLYYNIVSKLGTPFFTNVNGVGSFIPPSAIDPTGIQPYQLLVFKEIINIYMGDKKCGLYNFCKTRPDKDITNEHCLTSPWERGTEDELCPLGQLWKTWGLNGQIPID